MMTSEYRFTSRTEDMDVGAIYSFLTKSYWARGIPRATVQRAVENSLCFGVFRGSAQIGFARAITDSATFAYLADVYIEDAYRGRGLGKRLLAEINKHPQLQGLRRTMLATRDAHELYRELGFSSLKNPHLFMERWAPGVYEEP